MLEFTDGVPGEIEEIVTTEGDKGQALHTVTYLDKTTWLPVTGVWEERTVNHTTGWGYQEWTRPVTEIVRVA